MLGLVAYEGSSDEEDNSDTEETPPTPNKPNESKGSPNPSSNTKSKSYISDKEDSVCLPSSSSTDKPSEEPHISDDEDPIGNSLESLQVSSSTKVFHNLPAPTSHSIINSVPIAKPKAKGSGVKISIPSLDEFDEEEEVEEDKPRKIKLAASVKGSGLFSLLPKPRHEFLATPRQLPPRIVAPTGSKAPTSLVPRQLQGKHSVSKSNKPVLIEDDCHSDDDEGEAGDFFTIPDKKPEPDETTVCDKTMEEYLKPIVPKKTTNSEPQQLHIPSEVSELDEAGTSGLVMGPALPSESSEIELNNDVLRKLGARKRKGEDLIVREVNASSLMPDSREWLAQLSEETTYRPSHKKHDGPTSQQKRKHQITYLAFQAKANELDLKNQWANNRQTKRQTQSKYGF
uniref:Proline-rich protein PRCC n=2 Tax=Cacopsylla melanoneura TaxID=428564 RepID=A0A8D8RZT3_9HEMI